MMTEWRERQRPQARTRAPLGMGSAVFQMLVTSWATTKKVRVLPQVMHFGFKIKSIPVTVTVSRVRCIFLPPDSAGLVSCRPPHMDYIIGPSV
jgi:hypothetical protein